VFLPDNRGAEFAIVLILQAPKDHHSQINNIRNGFLLRVPRGANIGIEKGRDVAILFTLYDHVEILDDIERFWSERGDGNTYGGLQRIFAAFLQLGQAHLKGLEFFLGTLNPLLQT
jgi:hypothetical protein